MDHVMGLDLSLTGSGMCQISQRGDIRTSRFETKGKNTDNHYTTNNRLNRILDWVIQPLNSRTVLVMVEGPARGQHNGHYWDRGGLWHLVVNQIICMEIPVAICPPDNRPYWATGVKAGPKADKAAVAAYVARFWPDMPSASNDEYDAAVFATMAGQWLGWDFGPILARHETALSRVCWPEMPVRLEVVK